MTIDRAALRALRDTAARAEIDGPWPHDCRPRPMLATHATQHHDITCHAPSPRTVLALLDALDAAERERDAYKRAKAENDERFMVERDVARAERDQAGASLRTYGRHLGNCNANLDGRCNCGYAEALARAEGR